MAHLSAQIVARDALNDLYTRPDPRRDLVAAAHHDERAALKLAEVHSNLAIAESIDRLTATVREVFDTYGPVPFTLTGAGEAKAAAVLAEVGAVLDNDLGAR